MYGGAQGANHDDDGKQEKAAGHEKINEERNGKAVVRVFSYLAFDVFP